LMTTGKKREGKKLTANRPAPKAGRRGRMPYIVASTIVALVVVVVGIAYYQQYVTPFRRTVINVDGTRITMGAFLERARLSGSGGLGTLQAMTNEVLIKAGASRFGITVSREDVDRELRTAVAGGDNITITDAEFKEGYRQLLNEAKISDAKYRVGVTNGLLSVRLQEYLARQIPAQLEHAHVFGIFVATYEEIVQVKDRITAGEAFGAVAGELSIDSATAEKGGELAWIPQGAYVMTNMDPFLLTVGQVSDPVAVPTQDPNTPPSAYYVLLVTEKDTRTVDPQFLPEIESRGFQQWLADETKMHTIKWDYNSEIDAWLNWQLSKGQPKSTSTPTS
jgi:parvulin-like peptidyl-prolyl isomerase